MQYELVQNLAHFRFCAESEHHGHGLGNIASWPPFPHSRWMSEDNSTRMHAHRIHQSSESKIFGSQRKGIDELVNQCTNLQCLSVRGCFRLKNEDIVLLCSKLGPKLLHLTVSSIPHLGAPAAKAIATHCKSLVSLQARGTGFNNEGAAISHDLPGTS
jgi:hypothetical protein